MSVSLWCEEEEDRGPKSRTGNGPRRAPWDPSASGQRIIVRLRQSEERYLPSQLYTALIQRHPQHREQLARWALEVCSECGCDEAVFPLSVSLLDRYLSATLSLPVSPYCLAAACILLASKLTESETVTADTLCAAADYHFLPFNLREMERVVLATLRWDVAMVTPQDFIPHFLSMLGDLKDNDTVTKDFLMTLRRHSDTLVSLCMCDARFLGIPSSLIAAAAVNSALIGLGGKDQGKLDHMSSTLATLCQTDVGVLQFYTELIEGALKERLSHRLRDRGEEEEKEEGREDERAGTPTDLREIDF
ncbi:cyclin Dx [Chanos chanos]|uniref:Cyclin Dx n=1 Tax=Chanos chanos TaxID=29144 RepID=A0A6J2WPY4_CHACN|nr:G1/S-specific cyclin-D2-like [Chanos chanos]